MKGIKTISVVSKKVKKGYIERDAFLVFFPLSQGNTFQTFR